jgi:hypothetical protein
MKDICDISRYNPTFKKEAKLRGLDCGVENNNKTIVSSKIETNSYTPLKNYSNELILTNACSFDGFNYTIFKSDIVSKQYVDEALRRNLYCNNKHEKSFVTEKSKLIAAQEEIQQIMKLTNFQLLTRACTKLNSIDGILSFHRTSFYQIYVTKAKRRGLDCSVGSNYKTVASSNLQIRVLNLNNEKLIQYACENGFWDTSYKLHIKEAKKRGLDCSFRNKKNYIASNKKSKTNIPSLALDAANKRARELERKLAVLEQKQKQEQQRINTDIQIPTISAFLKQNGSNATISGRVTDNTQVAEVLIDGEQLSLTNNGTFKTELYIPRNGLNVQIVAYDKKGNKASKLM